MATLQCIKPEIVKPKTANKKRLQYGRKISVPCGKCGACLRRKSRLMAGKVLMELIWTRQQYRDEGFVWLLTLTYDKEKCSHYWRDPEPHDLISLWKPYMRRKVRQDKVVTEADKAIARIKSGTTIHTPAQKRNEVYWWLRNRGYSKQLIDKYESGDYPRAKTLVRRDVKLWLLRCRKELGYQPRIAYSGEYGDDEDGAGNRLPLHIESGNRPHYHVVVMGAPRSDIEKMLRQWKLGHPDPNPDTTEGQRKLDQQDYEAGSASGKIAGYLAGHTQAKLARSSTLLSGRDPEFTQGSQSPALGDRYVIENLIPPYAKEVARRLKRPDLTAAELLVEERLVAMWVTQATRWIKLYDGAYPLTERHKDMIRGACQGISLNAWDYCKLIALQPLEVQATIQESDDPGAKDDWKNHIENAKAELAKREQSKSHNRVRRGARSAGTRKRVRRTA